MLNHAQPKNNPAAPLATLLAQYRPGRGLPRDFYHDPAVYRAEMTGIWRSGWLFAGHACQLPNAGDFFIYEVDGDSILIARNGDGAVRALHNVCRHRGSLLVDQPRGHARSLVCPYHQWTYSLDGTLLTCRDMPAGLDRSALGLQPVGLFEIEGLIFISLADDPPDFEASLAAMAPLARPQGFDRARVAHTAEYDVRANWKIVWENNRECYHCEANHPQYVRANFDRYDVAAPNDDVTRKLAEATARSQARWAANGLALTHAQTGLVSFPDQGTWYSANRTPLMDGYVTESMDGQPVAPVMGDYDQCDVGTLRLRTLPNFWNHSSGDHAVSTRLTPAGPGLTRVQVTWLVDADAQPGRDYTLDRLLPFWKLTSEQDWEICERVQRGVTSSAYQPGPLSPSKEYNVDSFLRWYVEQLSIWGG